MKKIFLLAIVSVIFSVSSQAQVRKGNFLLNTGLGLGYYYAGNGAPASLIVSGEYAFTDKLSIGPYLGFTSWNYRYSGYKSNYTFIDFGVRASYHFNDLFQIDNKNLDIYGGGFAGFLSSSYSYDGVGNYNDVYDGGLRIGIHVGARYYFSEKVAGYGELGYGLAPVSIGLTFRF